jgi:SMI1 / KNR4 family (SUKH-1)/Domain of unknown function (DUF1851)
MIGHSMISSLLQDLNHLKGVVFHHEADAAILARFEAESGLMLPPEHKELLRSTNGIESSDGYVQLFGLYPADAAVDSVLWNRPEYWKFAWENRVSTYWCFGETAWGDQYAYAMDALRAGTDPEVFFMDALSMTPEVVTSSFTEFLQKEFVRSAKNPYDQMVRLAHQKFGPLEAGVHLVYVPSVLLGGTEDIDNVRKMNARSAMICNGDIAVQLDAGPTNGTVKSVQPYEDEMRRMRLRLVWE